MSKVNTRGEKYRELRELAERRRLERVELENRFLTVLRRLGESDAPCICEAMRWDRRRTSRITSLGRRLERRGLVAIRVAARGAQRPCRLYRAL